MLENSNDILTPEEARKILKIGRNKIYDLLKKRTIASIRIDRKYYIPKIYIIDFIEKNR